MDRIINWFWLSGNRSNYELINEEDGEVMMEEPPRSDTNTDEHEGFNLRGPGTWF